MSDHPCTCYQCDSDDCVQKTAHPAIPEEVRETLLAGLLSSEVWERNSRNPGAELDGCIAEIKAARDWLAKCPQASDKATCPKCGEDCLITSWRGKAYAACKPCDAHLPVLVIFPPREPKVTP